VTPRLILYWLATVAVLTIAIDFEALGVSFASVVQKGALFTILLTNGLLARGPSVLMNPPNAIILSAILLSMVFGTGAGEFGAIETAARALVLLLTITAALRGGMDFGVPFNLKLLRSIQLLPLICVTAGLALVPLGVEIGRIEGGVFRISGASSPAHLAMLCCGSIAASSLLFVADEKSSRPFFAVVALAILILTGARVAFVVGLIAGLPLVAYFVRIRSVARLLAAFCTALIVPVVAFFGIQRLLTRSLNNDGQLVTSGRDVAWQFFYERYQESPLFGHGLGSVLEMRLLTTDYRIQFFHVPHNEYLRFLVDLGAIGLLLFVISQLMIFVWVSRRMVHKVWFFVISGAHAGYAYFDNVYGTVQYLPYFMVIGLAVGDSIRRVQPQDLEG